MSSGQPTGGAAGPLTLGLPWRFPFYLPLNGPHPLVQSYVKDNPSVRTKVLSQNVALNAEHFDQILPGLCNQARLISDRQTPDYVRWAAPIEQAMIHAQSDRCSAVFHHTTPLHIGPTPWIFHFESFPSLFMPFIFSGATAGIDLKRQGCFERVRQAFSSEACRLIFTHMKSSREIFERMFGAGEITAKLHYISLGIESRGSDSALSKFDRSGPIRILFTNSLHQNPNSFFLRGGHHLVRAFSQLRQENIPIELTIISSVPHDLAAYFSDRDLDGVNWITDRVEDTVLEQLLLDHHIFALPAAGLHSYSLLRALGYGCVPIVSDALGYGEYTDPIQDSVFVVRGVRQMVYREEPDGWISDSYAEFTKPSREFAAQIYQIIAGNRNRAMLREMARVNLDYCASQFDLKVAQQEFYAKIAGNL